MATEAKLGWGRISDAVERVDLGELASGVVDEFREHQLLITASALAFRVFVATVVGALFVAGLLGFLGLTEVWRSDIAPDLRGSVSDPAYRLINDAVVRVLTDKSFLWATFGGVLAVWQLSRVVRVSGVTLNLVYGVDEERSFWEELRDTVVTAIAVGVVLLATLLVVRGGAPLLNDILGDSPIAGFASFVIRWSLAAVLLALAVGLVVRAAPAIERPLIWVSFGSALTVVGWIVSSLVFGLYLSIAHGFDSVYESLLSAFLLVEYLYFAAVIFLGGIVIDRLLQERSPAS